MTSLPPENAPQLVTCDIKQYEHIGPHEQVFEIGQRLPPFPCENPKPVAAPENQPRPSAPDYKVGQVIWNDSYKRYMKLLSIVWEGSGDVQKPHSYIVAAWNTQGTIQIHPQYMRPLADEEVSGARVEPGAHPPPDERALIRGIVQASLELACLRHNLCLEDSPPMVVEEVSEIITDTFNALQGVGCCDEQPCKEWAEIVQALMRARAPQRATSEKGTHDGVSCEIPRTPDIPAGTTGRDDYRDTDRGDNSEAPVAPSKLSAQELAVTIARQLYDWFVMGGIEPQQTHEQIRVWLAEYAFSSNAALELEADQRHETCHLSMQRTIDDLEADRTALEGQLREAQQAHQEAFNIGIDKQKECERLQEALRGRNPAANSEDICQECGGPNFTWFADSELWNLVVPGRVGVLCPFCFAERAKEVLTCTGWQLVAENARVK